MIMEFAEEKEKLVLGLKHSGYIHSKEVEDAFLRISREFFVPPSLSRFAYEDRPLDIGEGQTISAPHMVALMAEALDVRSGLTILEVGSGSGYHAAVMSVLIGPNGRLYSVERIPNLAENAQKNLEKAGINNVIICKGDGSLGLPDHSPFDRIYVTCAAPYIPQPLIDQLKDGGKLLIPIGKVYCELTSIEKRGEDIISKVLGGCAFVPLIGKHGF
jgi:protein-L-isoaspartate(D-aspartate) O-methyltransferase